MNFLQKFRSKIDSRTYFFTAIILYLIWVTGTYLLEGRIATLHSGSNIDRFIYAAIVNIIIGTVISGILVINVHKEGLFTKKDIGFSSKKKSIFLILIVIVVSTIMFIFQSLPTTNPIILLNGFAQVFPTSAAEVFVCWIVIGSAGKVISEKRRIFTIISLITISSILFGIYHFAHSAPFNTLNMVVLLTVIGFLTSIFFYIGKDLYSTILFHNIMATNGVLGSMDLETMTGPKYPLYFLMIISLIIIGLFVVRLKKIKR